MPRRGDGPAVGTVIRLAFDIGGTFTDFVLHDERGATHLLNPGKQSHREKRMSAQGKKVVVDSHAFDL